MNFISDGSDVSILLTTTKTALILASRRTLRTNEWSKAVLPQQSRVVSKSRLGGIHHRYTWLGSRMNPAHFDDPHSAIRPLGQAGIVLVFATFILLNKDEVRNSHLVQRGDGSPRKAPSAYVPNPRANAGFGNRCLGDFVRLAGNAS